MENFDTYYKLLTPEQKREVIKAAKQLPNMSIGRVAKIFVSCGANKSTFKRYLLRRHGVKYGGDKN